MMTTKKSNRTKESMTVMVGQELSGIQMSYIKGKGSRFPGPPNLRTPILPPPPPPILFITGDANTDPGKE